MYRSNEFLQRVLIYYIRKFSIFFSFDIYLNISTGQERRLMEITHFVNLFCDTLAQIKYSPEQKTEFDKNRVLFERNKMEADIIREVERNEREEFIEQWKLKNKMKGKKSKKMINLKSNKLNFFKLYFLIFLFFRML